MTCIFLRAATLAVIAAFAVPVQAKVRVIVVPPDASTMGTILLKHIADSVGTLMVGDKLLVYSARPIAQIGSVEKPSDQNMSKARVNALLAAQFKPIKDYLFAPPVVGVSADLAGNLMLPQLMDELGRNVIPAMPGKTVELLLIGSLLYFDPRDARSAMTDRYVPSDGTLRASRMEWPFSVAGAERRLASVTVHFCTTTASADFESTEHRLRVERFWTLWTTAQSGKVGTISSDLGTCFRRFNAGEASGQPTYEPSREPRAEMIRVAAHVPAALPASYENPGQWFLRDDVMISKTAPTASKGIAWIGIKWNANCDLDLYARGESTSPWLFYGSNRTAEGRFNKDFVAGTGEGQFEFIEFTREVEFAKTEAAINLYACDASAPPEGAVRVWMQGKVYESPFKLAAKSGNKGALPMTGLHWLRLDLRRIVGLKQD